MQFTRRDIITPANAITLAGLLVSILGCFFLDTLGGLATVLIGRSFDLIDGPVARATHSSQFSKYLDPAADKIALLAILISTAYYSLAPYAIIGYIFVQNVLVTLISIAAVRRGTAVEVIVAGKLNIFLQTVSVLAFILSKVTGDYQTFTQQVAWVSLLLSVPFAFWAIMSYAKQLKPAE